ncbi:MAG TPA: CbiX/SirB N-terminal domain-containing protein [Planctomycetota bacterium]|nr:CbiX/SirB N-terminal domain-containing protein [Planctomycetota bacterium]
MAQALLIVDHGSRRTEANEMLFSVGAICRKLKPGLIVHVAHMELAEPTIEQGFTQCVKDGATEVIVHPYMLSPGRHATSDIPNMVAEAAQKHPGVTFKVTPPLGLDDKLGEVILERAGIEYKAALSK